MTTSNALFAGVALIATTIAMLGLTSGLKAAAPNHTPTGTWQISTGGSAAWKLNTVSGELFYCGGASCVPAKGVAVNVRAKSPARQAGHPRL